MIVAREGESSYQIKVKPGHIMGAHRGALKMCTPENFSEEPIKLFYHRRTSADPEGAPDECILETILVHEERNGKMLFKVKWEGYEDPSFEPAKKFSKGFLGP